VFCVEPDGIVAATVAAFEDIGEDVEKFQRSVESGIGLRCKIYVD